MLLRNAFICTGLPGGFIALVALLVEGSRIAWVGPEAALPPQPPGMPVQDLGGRVVIPGLINTHERRPHRADLQRRVRGIAAGAPHGAGRDTVRRGRAAHRPDRRA